MDAPKDKCNQRGQTAIAVWTAEGASLLRSFRPQAWLALGRTLLLTASCLLQLSPTSVM